MNLEQHPLQRAGIAENANTGAAADLIVPLVTPVLKNSVAGALWPVKISASF
jgi:hypothetical protein